MKKIIFAILLSSLIYGCSTDFDINADWKDISIVYCILNQNETVHYVKINKAFLGDGNAITMAADPDSCTYGNYLEVTMEEWIDNNQTRTWLLDTTTIYNKEAGTFYYPDQVVYKFNAYLDTLDRNTVYKLNIKNKKTGKIIYSETPLVHSFTITKPSANQQAVFNSGNSYQVKWYSGVNGRLYQTIIRFNYWEKNINTGDSALFHVDWNLGTQNSKTTDGGEEMSTNYFGQSFYKYLKDVIPQKSDVIRRVAHPNDVDFIFTVAADEFYTYMEVNKPTSGVVQEKPEYTNISNGIGLFSSRYDIDVKLEMNKFSLDSLYHGVYTKYLSFQ
ncbi:MAG TPA: hypothetical protein PKK00_00375 [Bacteroidales bacterium]|nr:hypothetical protein [Bacteroidales bacterium]HPS16227.1 hypothetical protein [Bacteroidales bacterium]